MLRKGKDWYMAIPFELPDMQDKTEQKTETTIGVDLGLRHIAVVSEPESGK
ncbi:MAG TPA: transposase [Clostridiaceae bacterium]|jgi:putative transposase|nr:transposase [Clostridiaceae bacterium]